MVTAPHSFAWLAWLASDTPIIVHSSIAASASEGLGDLALKPAQRPAPVRTQCQYRCPPLAPCRITIASPPPAFSKGRATNSPPPSQSKASSLSCAHQVVEDSTQPAPRSHPLTIFFSVTDSPYLSLQTEIPRFLAVRLRPLLLVATFPHVRRLSSFQRNTKHHSSTVCLCPT